MSIKKKKPIYPGALGERRSTRKLTAFDFFSTSTSLSERLKEWEDEDMRNLDLLCTYFGIPSGSENHSKLAIRLAEELEVPAFWETKKRGAKTKWNKEIGAALMIEIDRLVEDLGITQDMAAARLAQETLRSNFISSYSSCNVDPDPVGDLKRHYYKFKGTEHTCKMQNSFRTFAEENSIDDWVGFIESFMNYPPEE